MPFYNKLLEDDLRHILGHTESLWKDCKGKTVFITGGTGFFGKWFLETISFLNCEMNLGLKTIVLSRAPDKFLSDYPYFTQPMICLIKGDVRNFSFPKEDIQYIIHAATAASDKLNTDQSLEVFDTIVDGTHHVLNLAKEKKVESFLFTSSGAVYGKQPPDMTHIPESYTGAPDCIYARSAYGEGKRAGEMLCSLFYHQYQVPVKIARCFALVGPYLPLDAHFAIGNFIRDGSRGCPIQVKGDGTSYRSYLYAADLVVWLWTILFKGNSGYAYNVGSDQTLTISDLAYIVANNYNPPMVVHISKSAIQNKTVERYVPNIQRAKTELGLEQWITLQDAIQRTILFEKKIR
jgi:dTDP-glucose 4,6-dehydratase